MFDGMSVLLEKSDLLAAILVKGFPLLVALVVLLIIGQRKMLGSLLEKVLHERQSSDPVEQTVSDFKSQGNMFSNGIVGTLLISAWWVFMGITLVKSYTLTIDLLRFNEPGYIDPLLINHSMKEIVRSHSAGLITRSFVAIVSLPSLMLTLLALDQFLFRPRTRLLDSLRWQILISDTSMDNRSAKLDQLNQREEFRWNWPAFMFHWIWLAFKGLYKKSTLIFGLHFISGFVASVISYLILPMNEPTPGPFEFVPPMIVRAFVPLIISTLLATVPGIIIIIAVGLRGSGWLRKKEICQLPHPMEEPT
ncbi:MAG: DUF2628 domain-containing protein [bacterium]|nr:DUF2628 domain-containing protein [bacterium]